MLHVYLLCHNEAVLLPHAVEHYRRRVPGVTFTILDNESSDRSVAIANELGCAVQSFNTGDALNDDVLREKYQQRYERGKEQMAQNLGTHYTDDVTKVTAEFSLRRSVARRFSDRPYNATPSLLWRVVRRLRRPIA
jgi:hypothetical protein